jgi:thiol-disulfide isomerase/thioredoxin
MNFLRAWLAQATGCDMLTFDIGPFAIPVGLLIGLMTLFATYATADVVSSHRRSAELTHILMIIVIIGLLAARLIFIREWYDTYRHTPWDMLNLRDGGFKPKAGIAAGLVVATWFIWRRREMRKSLLAGFAAGAIAWLLMFGALRLSDAVKPSLPDVTLTALSGESVALRQLAAGKPLVLNLWASWCPPCRHEMPVLAAAQQARPDVNFIFANQGEDGATAQHYMSVTGLRLANVLLDRDKVLAREVRSGVLPTSLFYDASGRLVDTYVGELSAASLASKLKQIEASR